MSSPRRYFFAVLIYLIATGVATAQNKPNQSVALANPTQKIIFGHAASFRLQGDTNGWAITSATWQYSWVVGTCTGSSTGFDINDPIKLMYVGTLGIQCTVVYNNGSGGKTMTAKPTLNIAVPPPDDLRIVSGDNVSVAFGQINPTVFQIRCKGEDSIYLAGVYAQERISNARNPSTNKVIPLVNSGWVPVPGVKGALTFAYQGNGRIIDAKGYPNNFVADLPAGTGLLTLKQEIRVILYDPCGNPMPPVVLGTFNVTFTKDTQNQQGGTYTVTHN